MALGGGFAESVRSSVRVPGDAAATATNIVQHATPYRFAFASDRIDFACFLGVGLLLYVIFTWTVRVGPSVSGSGDPARVDRSMPGWKQMMWYYGGFGWIWMAGMMLLIWGGLIVLGVWAIRSLTGPRQGGDPALDVLRRRLAAGEITPEEFDKTRKTLGA